MPNLLGAARVGLKNACGLAREIFILSPTRPFEGIFSLLLMVSSFVILNPETNIYGNANTYDYIRWMPEWAFGSILLFIALNTLAAAISKSIRYRAYAMMGMTLAFSLMFILFFSANTRGMLIPWMAIFGLVSFSCAIRLYSIYWASKHYGE